MAGDEAVRESGGGSFDLVVCSCALPEAPPATTPVPAPEEVTYRTPKILDHPVDVCLHRSGKDCGKPAADAFCKSFGLKQSARFVEAPALEAGTAAAAGVPATWWIGEHDVNEGPDRRPFESIVCV